MSTDGTTQQVAFGYLIPNCDYHVTVFGFDEEGKHVATETCDFTTTANLGGNVIFTLSGFAIILLIFSLLSLPFCFTLSLYLFLSPTLSHSVSLSLSLLTLQMCLISMSNGAVTSTNYLSIGTSLHCYSHYKAMCPLRLISMVNGLQCRMGNTLLITLILMRYTL